jgi:uncharacterized membrane protein YgaE (UPF0421/DUF939 family)
MEITSFILGMLTIIGMAVAVVVVLGLVKIYKQTKKVENLENDMYREFEHIHRTISENSNEIHQQIHSVEEQIFRSIEDEKRDITSYIDSRIDKLQSNKTKEVIKG